MAFRIIFGQKYLSYDNALQLAKLPKIEQRYEMLLLRFAQKCSKNPKTKHMLPLARKVEKTINHEKYEVPMARKKRFLKTSIPPLARFLNKP